VWEELPPRTKDDNGNARVETGRDEGGENVGVGGNNAPPAPVLFGLE